MQTVILNSGIGTTANLIIQQNPSDPATRLAHSELSSDTPKIRLTESDFINKSNVKVDMEADTLLA